MIKLIKSAFHNEEETREKLAGFVRAGGQLSMSSQCLAFEAGFAAKQGRAHAVYVNSGSSANLILMQALLNLGRLKKGDRVGVSAVTWSTNVMPLIQLGLTPIPIDCELDTLNVSPRTLRSNITEIDALFLTNALGLSDDLPGIKDLCEEHGVSLYEDNCESLGSRVGGRLLGNYGKASTFSFFVGHQMSTIEGGMVCTDDDELHDMLIIARAHGWDRNLAPTVQERLRSQHNIDPFYSLYTFYDLGYGLRPTELQGFIGTTQLPYWDQIVSSREKNFRVFEAALNKNSDFYPLRTGHMDTVSNFAMPVIAKSREHFERYRERFTSADVEIRPIIAGDMTKQVFYKKYVPDSGQCSNASVVHNQGFYFGNNPEMTEEEVAFLAGLLAD